MTMQLKVVNPKTLKLLNQKLSDLQMLHDEICKAESAGVGDLGEHKQSCIDLQKRIEQFKRVYFSHEI